MKRRIIITDRPQRRVNIANYEQRLRKLRTVFALILCEITEALEQVDQDRLENRTN